MANQGGKGVRAIGPSVAIRATDSYAAIGGIMIDPIPVDVLKKPIVLVVAGSLFHFWEWAVRHADEVGPMTYRSQSHGWFATAEVKYVAINHPEQAQGYGPDTKVILTGMYRRHNWIGQLRERYRNVEYQEL
jgi:hypothetical protein